MQAYYNDDLSLSEIAEGEGISRQGVRHLIKKGEEHLLFLEEKLGLANHYGEIRASALSLLRISEELKSGEITAESAADAISEATNIIIKGV